MIFLHKNMNFNNYVHPFYNTLFYAISQYLKFMECMKKTTKFMTNNHFRRFPESRTGKQYIALLQQSFIYALCKFLISLTDSQPQFNKILGVGLYLALILEKIAQNVLTNKCCVKSFYLYCLVNLMSGNVWRRLSPPTNKDYNNLILTLFNSELLTCYQSVSEKKAIFILFTMMITSIICAVGFFLIND